MLCRISGASVANFSPHQRTSVGTSPKQTHRHTRTHITTHTYLKSTRPRSKLSQHATTQCKDSQTHRYRGRASARVVYHVDLRHAVPTFFAWSDDLQCLVGTTKAECVFLSYHVLFVLQDLLGFDIIPDFSGWNPFLIPDTGYPNALAPHSHTHTHRTMNLFSNLGLLRDSVCFTVLL